MEEKGKIFWLPTIMKLLAVLLALGYIIPGIKIQIEGLYKFDGSTVEAMAASDRIVYDICYDLLVVQEL